MQQDDDGHSAPSDATPHGATASAQSEVSPLDPEVAQLLTPTIERVVRETIRRDPKWVSDIILPGLGPAIRRTVADSFRNLIEQVNDALDYSLSKEGIKWRIEAARSKRSFAEIVMAKTLVYRIEQVLLIHRETGLLLRHVTADENAVDGQADMVSSMLTAIQDFARDAFAASETDVLKTMEVGELTVWIHGSPKVLIAAVIRGNAPREARAHLDQALEDIQLSHAEALDTFDGDTGPFVSLDPVLQGCLMEERLKPRKNLPALITLLILLTGGLGTFITLEVRDRMRWQQYFETLDHTPGIVVSEVYRRGNDYALAGLRDPLAANPFALLNQSGLDTNRVTFKWEAYNALNEDFVLARAYEALNPPETVELSLQNNRLSAKGSAPRDWIREASLLSKALPGVSYFVGDELIDLDTSEYEILVWEFKAKSFKETREQIEAMVLDVRPDDREAAAALETDLARMRDLLVKLAGLSRFLNKSVSVEIRAIAPQRGGGSNALVAASQRANRVHEALAAAGVSALPIMASAERSQSTYTVEAPVIVRIADRETLN